MTTSLLPKRVSLRTYGLALVLLLPALIFFVLFVVFPVIQAARYSLYDWKGYGPMRLAWLENFFEMFKDKVFITALFNNLKIVAISLFIQLPLAFLFALLIGRNRSRGESIFRSIYFFPYIMAEIISGIIWKFIYHPEYGLPTQFVQLFNPDADMIALLGNVDTAFIGILIVVVWKYLGFHMILYIAGLQNVPTELEDAATVDGANPVQVVMHVVIPSLKNTFIISIFLSVIGSFNVFDIVWALGQGGPVNSTETLVTYLYKFGFRRNAFGYGCAVAVTIFLICFVFNLVYQRFITQGEKNGTR